MSLRSRLALGLAVLTVALGTPVVATAAAPRAGDALRRRPPRSPPAIRRALTLVVPLTVPPNETGLLDADTLTRYTAPLGLLTRQLDALVDAPVAIGLDPLIVASIRVLGTSAPPSALAWLERLRGGIQRGLRPRLRRRGRLRGGEHRLARPPDARSASISPSTRPTSARPQTASPTPTPSPDARRRAPIPPLPTLEDLLEWPYTLENVAWPADDTLTAEHGRGDRRRRLRDRSSSRRPTSPSPGRPSNLGDITGVVSDATLSALVRAATHAAERARASRARSTPSTRASPRLAAASPGRRGRRDPRSPLALPELPPRRGHRATERLAVRRLRHPRRNHRAPGRRRHRDRPPRGGRTAVGHRVGPEPRSRPRASSRRSSPTLC